MLPSSRYSSSILRSLVSSCLDFLGHADEFCSDEEIQSTCLRWIAEFLNFVQPTMVPFAPRLIPVILSSLAHHVASIRTAANETNYNLYIVIQGLPILATPTAPPINSALASPSIGSETQTPRERTLTASPTPPNSVPFPSLTHATSASRLPVLDRSQPPPVKSDSAPLSILTSQLESLPLSDATILPVDVSILEVDPFDYGSTVNALTLQFLNEHEETRVAALEWLLMLHQKAPKKAS